MYWACANSSSPLRNSAANGDKAALSAVFEARARPENRGRYTVAKQASSAKRPYTRILALLK
jgi:hypothetical protein